MDLNTLYRTVIMDNYKNPKNKGLKQTDDYHFVHLNNPSCGDEMNVEVKIEDGIIKDVRQDGHGCSISMSSASVMSDVLIGKTVEEARKIILDFWKKFLSLKKYLINKVVIVIKKPIINKAKRLI